VTTSACANAIGATQELELLAAADADDFVRQVSELLASPQRATSIGRSARQCVLRDFSWDAQLAGLDRFIVSHEGAA